MQWLQLAGQCFVLQIRVSSPALLQAEGWVSIAYEVPCDVKHNKLEVLW